MIDHLPAPSKRESTAGAVAVEDDLVEDDFVEDDLVIVDDDLLDDQIDDDELVDLDHDDLDDHEDVEDEVTNDGAVASIDDGRCDVVSRYLWAADVELVADVDAEPSDAATGDKAVADERSAPDKLPTFGFLARAEAEERQRDALVELLFAPATSLPTAEAGRRTALFPSEATVSTHEIGPVTSILAPRPAVAPLDLTRLRFGSERMSASATAALALEAGPSEVVFVAAAPTRNQSLFWPIVVGLLAVGLILLAVNLLWPLTG